MEAKRLTESPAEPEAKAWKEADRERVELAAVPIASQPSRYVRTAWADRPYGLVRELTAQAAHDGENLYLRLEWASPTLEAEANGDNKPSHPIEGPDAFPDAVAAMFPANGRAPLETMGNKKSPVNVWQWSADAADGVEDLTVTGLGTVRPTGAANGLRAKATSTSSDWQVVLTRPLKPATGDGAPTFAPGKKIQVAFAVWAGANQERAGIKSASQSWVELDLEE